MWSKEGGTSVYLVMTHNSGHSGVSAVRDSYDEAVEASKQTARATLDYWEASSNKSGCSTVFIQIVPMHTHGKVWETGTRPVLAIMLERRGRSINLFVGGAITPLAWVNTQTKEQEDADN